MVSAGMAPRLDQTVWDLATHLFGDCCWLALMTLTGAVGPDTSCGFSIWLSFLLTWWLIPGASILRDSWTEAASPSLTQPWKTHSISFTTFCGNEMGSVTRPASLLHENNLLPTWQVSQCCLEPSPRRHIQALWLFRLFLLLHSITKKENLDEVTYVK